MPRSRSRPQKDGSRRAEPVPRPIERRALTQNGLPNDSTSASSSASASARGMLIIACGALAHEITALRRANSWDDLDVRCLPAELHNRPEKIPAAVRDLIHSSRGRYGSIFVAYGDCGT